MTDMNLELAYTLYEEGHKENALFLAEIICQNIIKEVITKEIFK